MDYTSTLGQKGQLIEKNTNRNTVIVYLRTLK